MIVNSFCLNLHILHIFNNGRVVLKEFVRFKQKRLDKRGEMDYNKVRKLLFNGGGRALHAEQARRHPPRTFCKRFLDLQKSLNNHIYQYVLKVFGVLRTFANFAVGKFAPSVSEDVFKKVLSRRRPCPQLTDKPKFENQTNLLLTQRNTARPFSARAVFLADSVANRVASRN